MTTSHVCPARPLPRNQTTDLELEAEQRDEDTKRQEQTETMNGVLKCANTKLKNQKVNREHQ